jgi:hypothetical protein
MKTRNRYYLLAGILSLLTILPVHDSLAAKPGTGAVTCDACKTVWVKTSVPSTPYKGGVSVYHDTKTMACPYCESAVQAFFKRGSLKHHCSHCGGNLTHCTEH